MNFTDADLPLKHAGIEFFGSPPLFIPYLFNPSIKFHRWEPTTFSATLQNNRWQVYLTRPIVNAQVFAAIDDHNFLTATVSELAQDFDRIAATLTTVRLHASETTMSIYQFQETQRDPAKSGSIEFVLTEL